MGKAMARAQRLQGRAVERPLHHRRRPDRLDVRRPPDLLVHLGALSARDVDASGATTTRRTRRSPPRRPATAARCSTSSISAAARTARSRRTRRTAASFNDDFEIYRVWSSDPYGTDTATDGTWAPTRSGADVVRRLSDPARDGVLRGAGDGHGWTGRDRRQPVRPRRRDDDDPLGPDQAALDRSAR